MLCYITYVVSCYNICYITCLFMACYRTHVMSRYNICYITCFMLCYITCVMLCYKIAEIVRVI